ncbi:MAG TPA: hypothetical protein VMY35_17305 [Phycisphaerae bacterium]|nr:hypothetical protein [Phycisphaerae bacterium]
MRQQRKPQKAGPRRRDAFWGEILQKEIKILRVAGPGGTFAIVFGKPDAPADGPVAPPDSLN